MNRAHLLMAVAILAPVITAIEGDIATYRKAKKKDPATTFDTMIMAVKVGKALVVGITAAAAVSEASGAAT